MVNYYLLSSNNHRQDILHSSVSCLFLSRALNSELAFAFPTNFDNKKLMYSVIKIFLCCYFINTYNLHIYLSSNARLNSCVLNSCDTYLRRPFILFVPKYLSLFSYIIRHNICSIYFRYGNFYYFVVRIRNPLLILI